MSCVISALKTVHLISNIDMYDNIIFQVIDSDLKVVGVLYRGLTRRDHRLKIKIMYVHLTVCN